MAKKERIRILFFVKMAKKERIILMKVVGCRRNFNRYRRLSRRLSQKRWRILRRIWRKEQTNAAIDSLIMSL
ncbi:hypothetical protein ACET3Z_021536 [Daucus carota]